MSSSASTLRRSCFMLCLICFRTYQKKEWNSWLSWSLNSPGSGWAVLEVSKGPFFNESRCPTGVFTLQQWLLLMGWRTRQMVVFAHKFPLPAAEQVRCRSKCLPALPAPLLLVSAAWVGRGEENGANFPVFQLQIPCGVPETFGKYWGKS